MESSKQENQKEVEVQHDERESQKPTEVLQPEEEVKANSKEKKKKSKAHNDIDPNLIIESGKRIRKQVIHQYEEEFVNKKKKIKTEKDNCGKKIEKKVEHKFEDGEAYIEINEEAEEIQAKKKDKKQEQVEEPKYSYSLQSLQFRIDDEIKPWKEKKNEFQEKLTQLLSMGIPALKQTINQKEQEVYKEKMRSEISNFQNDILQLLAIQIESSNLNLGVLAQQSNEWIKQTFQDSPEIKIEEVVANISKQVCYLPKDLKDTEIQRGQSFSLNNLFRYAEQEIPEEFKDVEYKSLQFNVWEIKSHDYLKLFCSNEEFKNNRLIRRYLQKQILNLEKLIKIIKKTNLKDNLHKIEEQFQSYINARSEKLKLVTQKTKKQKIIGDENQEDQQQQKKKNKGIKQQKEIKESKPEILEEQKVKTPIKTPEKNSGIKQQTLLQMFTKHPNSKILKPFAKPYPEKKQGQEQIVPQEYQQNELLQNEQIQIEIQIEDKQFNNEEQKGEEQKIIGQEEQKPTQDENQPKQKTLLKYFQTKSENIKGKQEPKEQQKELFKMIDYKPQRKNSSWDSQAETQFNCFINNKINRQLMSIEDIKKELIRKIAVQNKNEMEIEINGEIEIEIEEKKVAQKKNRKVYIHLFDSNRILKGQKITKRSSKITGKKPLIKDEDVIDYEMESEDEIQEFDAESLSHSNQNEEESKDVVSESDEKFIVPDGYLSEAEVEDKEDYKTNRLVIQQQQVQQQQEQKNQHYTLLLRESSIENFKPYEIIQFFNETQQLPLKCKKENQGTCQWWNEEQNLKKFFEIVHGSFFSKQKVVDEVKKLKVEESEAKLTSNMIKNKLKEFSEKRKVEPVNKERWMIKDEFLNRLKFSNEEINKLLNCQQSKYELCQKQEKENKQNKMDQTDKKKLIKKYLKDKNEDKNTQKQENEIQIILDDTEKDEKDN